MRPKYRAVRSRALAVLAIRRRGSVVIALALGALCVGAAPMAVAAAVTPAPGAATPAPSLVAPASATATPTPSVTATPAPSVTTTPAPSATATPAVVQQPRPFGYVLGDTLTQRVLLQASGRSFDPAQLPPAERAGLWFARRSSRIDVTDDHHRWLVLDYQLVNAPQVLMTVNLPSVALKPRTGDEMLTVPEWPVSITPLTPRTAFAKGGLQELRPDHPAPMLSTGALRRQLEMSSGALALSVGAWLTWWLVRSIRATASQPFARAMREIRRNGNNDDPGAWLALHRAFDRTAQRTLQLSTLPALFEQAPHFETQRAAIEHFYAESYHKFFGVGDTRAVGVTLAAGAEHAALPPRALCAILRRIEKQNER